LKHFFEPGCQAREEVAVDETEIEIDGEGHYVRAAVDCETLEVLAVDVSPGRSSLDSVLFLTDVLKRCRGRPLLRADRGPWYDWPLDRLDCEYERETWGSRSRIEAWFGLFTYRTRRFWHRFSPTEAPPTHLERCSEPSPLSTMRRSTLATPRCVLSGTCAGEPVTGSAKIVTEQGRESLLEQSIQSGPENLGWDRLLELSALVVALVTHLVLILEVYRSETRVVVVAVPAAIEPRVRIGVMDAVVRLVVDEPPLDVERGRLWPSGRDDTVGIDPRAEIPLDDAVRFVRDRCDGRMPL
jgi:hypothetical protein